MVLKVLLCSVVAGFATEHVSADLVNPSVPDWRGDVGAQYYGWDSFTSPYSAPNFNDSGDAGGMLFNFAEGAMITGSGNIYNQGGGLEIHVYGYGPLEQAVLNVASMGTEMDYEGVSLWVTDGENGQMFSYDTFATNYYEEVPNFGANVSTSYEWDLSEYSGVITEWAFFVNGTAEHNVLDAVTVDIFTGAVPAPSALILLGIAGVKIRRRR
ncbi:MAG: hypothetical protein ISR75_03880 [Phycisphaerales bacterium]|nr:hypothetical protein [Planctomycetota bacterium]MBL6997558.1 hypothetical protein [Phycisphaerales bacterium]